MGPQYGIAMRRGVPQRTRFQTSVNWTMLWALPDGSHRGALDRILKSRVKMMRRKCLAVGLILAGLFAVAWMPPALFAGDEKSSNSPVAATPPAAKKVRTENHINGGNLVDDYRWLREKPNPEVAQYLEAENAYTDAVMKPTEALQKKLYDEMVSHIKETDVNVPYKDGDYFYYYDGKRASSIKFMRGRKGTWRPRSNSPLTSTS